MQLLKTSADVWNMDHWKLLSIFVTFLKGCQKSGSVARIWLLCQLSSISNRVTSHHRSFHIFARRAYCVGGSLKIMCVRPSVRRRPSVAIKNDQVLNGKTSLWKVSSSKRDPKKEHLQDLIARFWDVDEISGNQNNWKIIWSNDVFECFWTKLVKYTQ